MLYYIMNPQLQTLKKHLLEARKTQFLYVERLTDDIHDAFNDDAFLQEFLALYTYKDTLRFRDIDLLLYYVKGLILHDPKNPDIVKGLHKVMPIYAGGFYQFREEYFHILKDVIDYIPPEHFYPLFFFPKNEDMNSSMSYTASKTEYPVLKRLEIFNDNEAETYLTLLSRVLSSISINLMNERIHCLFKGESEPIFEHTFLFQEQGFRNHMTLLFLGLQHSNTIGLHSDFQQFFDYLSPQDVKIFADKYRLKPPFIPDNLSDVMPTSTWDNVSFVWPQAIHHTESTLIF